MMSWLRAVSVFGVLVLLLGGCGRDRTRGPVTPFDAGGGTDAGPGVDTGVPPPPPTDSGTPPPPPPGMYTDPMCIDGMFSETPPNPGADISDLVAGYSSAGYQEFVAGALQRRYPVGASLVAGGRAAAGALGGTDCVDAFLSDRSSAQGVIRQLSTIVHECGHFFDIGEGGFEAVYVINDELRISCSGGRATSQGGNTFARSRINGDEYSALRPSDSYRNVYLDGDPDNGSFEGGDQGFDSVIEEATQYVNSLATGYAFSTELSGGFGVSERDGILTFLWYIERYLAYARSNFPSAYAFISGDACWRQAILTVWGRAWLYLGLTEDMPFLGIDDDAILELVTSPVMLQEIEMIRAAEGC